jgi:hypothetical protein
MPFLITPLYYLPLIIITREVSGNSVKEYGGFGSLRWYKSSTDMVALLSENIYSILIHCCEDQV